MESGKKYHHGHLREALIAAGLEILETRGLEALSLRACAEAAGVSHTAPKNHFAGLTGLRSAIAAEGYARLTARMTEGLAPGADRSAQRNAAFEGYVAFAVAHPALFELMFAREKTDRADPALQAAIQAAFAVLREASAGLVWDKSNTPDAALRAQLFHWSLVHGFAQLSASGRLDSGAKRGLGILDIVPGFAYRD